MTDRGEGVLPQGESLRQALRWLDERARSEPALDRKRAVLDACTRFDLSPMEEDFLLRQWGSHPP